MSGQRYVCFVRLYEHVHVCGCVCMYTDRCNTMSICVGAPVCICIGKRASTCKAGGAGAAATVMVVMADATLGWLGVPLCRLHNIHVRFGCMDNANVQQSNSSAASRVCTMADAAVLAASLLDRGTCFHALHHAAVDVPVVAPAVYMAIDICDGPYPPVPG